MIGDGWNPRLARVYGAPGGHVIIDLRKSANVYRYDPREIPEVPPDIMEALAGCEYSWKPARKRESALPPPRRGHRQQRPNFESETFLRPPRRSGHGPRPAKWGTRRPRRRQGR